MSNLDDIILARVDGVQLSLAELLHTLKLQGRLRELVAAALADKLVAQTAQAEGIRVTDEELQRAADAFRMQHGLNKAASTRRWLERHGLAQTDLEESLERGLLRQKLADKVMGDEVDKHFAEIRARFDRARLRHIVVDKEAVALELLARIQEEDADFGELARQHSLDARTKTGGGHLGIVRRDALPPALAEAVFASRDGALLGPIAVEGTYRVVEVVALLRGQLDPPTRAALQQSLFQRWLTSRVSDGRVEMKLDF